MRAFTEILLSTATTCLHLTWVFPAIAIYTSPIQASILHLTTFINQLYLGIFAQLAFNIQNTQ